MENLLFSSRFNDLDEFAHGVHAWDLDFRQLDSGEFHTDLLQLASVSNLLTHVQFNRLLDQRGSTPAGKWTFGIFGGHSSSVIWHEQEISPNTIVVYKPGTEIDCVSRPRFSVFSLSYSEEDLNMICSSLDLSEVHVLLKGLEYFECDIKSLSHVRLQLNQMVEAARHLRTKKEQAALTHYLDSELPELVLLAIAGSRLVEVRRPTHRLRAIKLVKEYLEAYPKDPITVSQLCKITGASERTLQYAFQDQYGIPPKTYLKIYRLNGFRRELLNSNCDTVRVNNVAGVWGFWHMGQLASDYRKLFRELPSETLRRNVT